MKRFVTAVALAAVCATSAAAQRHWAAQLGIQGGFSRVKPAGTGQRDHVDLFDLPGFGLSPLVPAYSSLFAVVPVGGRLALEPSLAVSQIAAGGGLSLLNVGIRLDYAVAGGLYAAVGGTIGYRSSFSGHDTQLGIQAAAGYRLRLSPVLDGRLEAQWISTGTTDEIPTVNAYSLLIGVSSRLTRPAPAPAGPTATGRSWRPALGIAGGYASTHIRGLGDFTTLSFPGFGAGLNAGGISIPIANPPTFFAILPLSARLALEPGIDAHRVQDMSTGRTDFSANYSLRLDCTVAGGWYGAAGPNVWHLVSTGETALTLLGASVAWGYRFRLTEGVGGRIEVSYLMFPHNDTLGQASNTVGLMLGAMMPMR